ncbi:MAG: 3'-5' exonuclease, partial [Planctomycetota bacterium]
DTSAAQWRAVRPIAGQIALTQDGSRSLFAVGDVKQSIYGWRGGEPRILDELEHVTSPPDPVEFDSRPLNHSYRSSLSVIAAVNAVFDDIGRNRAVLAASPPAAEEFAKWFGTQSTARTEPGFGLFLDLPEKGDGESADDVRVRVAVARAKEHWLRLRDRGGRVAILVRRNKMVGRLVAELKRQGVPAVGRGGGSLLDTEANLALLQTLHLASFPNDSAAAHDLASSPLQRLVGLPQNPGQTARRQASLRLRSRFAEHGVAAVFDEWRRALDADLGPREVVRMRQLVETVERLERGADRTPLQLLELVSVAKVDDPGHGAVTVLNVHQSKGLEYDVVLVTDLGDSILPSASRQKFVTMASKDPAGRLVRVSRAPSEKLRWPEVAELREDEQRRSVREALCMLYVALTRARDGLEVHLEPVSYLKSGEESAASSRSLAAVCRESLGQPEDGLGEIEGCTVRWRHGHLAPAPDAVDALDREESEADEPISPAPRLQVVGGHRTRRARAASRQAGAEERQRLFELPPRDALDRGQALHAAFELVGFVGEDPLPTDESVDLKIAAACPGRDAEWRRERIAEFRDAIEADEVRAALARPGPDAELRREHAFLRVLGGAVQEGAIDRLVLERDADGRVLRAEVLDYKSGSTVDPAALDQKHGDQLRAYRDVVVEQFGGDPAAVRLCILAIGGRRLVEIG